MKVRAHTKKVQKKTPKTLLGWPEIALIVILIVSVLAILISMLLRAGFDPQGDAENALERITDDYYRAHLYPQLLNYDMEKTEQLETYAEVGVPTIYLRQLLNYNDERKLISSDVFNNQYIQCDTNRTRVRYYPHEPYGPHDYTVDYIWHCTNSLIPGANTESANWVQSIKHDAK